MQTQFSGSVRGTRSNERTKRCIEITAWAIRILALLSIVFLIVALVRGDFVFGIFMIVTAILSVLSPFNFSSCCYLDWNKDTTAEKTIGRPCIYLWLFISNIGYVIMFWYSWPFWSSWYTYDKTFALISTFFLTISNFYSFCLVYKHGCCFMSGVTMGYSQQRVETAVVINEQTSGIGERRPVNGVQFTNGARGVQERITSPLVQNSQPNPAEPLYIALPPQQAFGVPTDSATSGRPKSPPPYAKMDPIKNQSQ